MKSLFLIFLIWLSLCYYCKAQDPHLSQYYGAPLYLNPAMNGLFNGSFRVTGQYRSQWRSITVPYVTTGLSYDMKFGKASAGINIINNRQGWGDFNILNSLLNGAYDITLDSSKFHHISSGLQLGLIHKSIDWFKLYFDNQYVRGTGGNIDKDAPSGESFTNSSTLVPDVNMGILYYYVNLKSVLNPFAGFSLFHLTQPNETFFSSTTILYRRYVVHGGVKININELWQLTPMINFMQQGNFHDISFNFITHYYLKESNSILIFGPTYRVTMGNRDALVVNTGLKKGKFIYRLSYDVNTSILGALSKGQGGVEFGIQYIGVIMPPFPKNACPRL